MSLYVEYLILINIKLVGSCIIFEWHRLTLFVSIYQVFPQEHVCTMKDTKEYLWNISNVSEMRWNELCSVKIYITLVLRERGVIYLPVKLRYIFAFRKI